MLPQGSKLIFKTLLKVFTYITSPSFDHEAAVLQCFHFWFFIDGFFDGVKNESLKVVQQSAGDVPENELWNWPSATLEWSEVHVLNFTFPTSSTAGSNGGSSSSS